MADYLKLLDEGAGLVGLDDELELILALKDIATSWGALVQQAKKIDGAETAEALLAAIVSNLNDPKLDPLFALVPGAREKLKGLFDRIGALKDKIPGKYWKLLEPLSTYQAGGDGLVKWALGVDKDATLGKKVKLGIKGNGEFDLDAAASPRLGETDATAPLLRIGAHAEVKGQAGTDLKIRFGTAGASASASLDVDLDYYFERKPESEFYGAAVARRIVALPDPFDFDSIWAAFQDGPTAAGDDLGLAGLTFHFSDAAEAKAQLAVSATGSLVAQILADVKLTLDASGSITNSFDLSLRALDAVADGTRPVEIIFGRAFDRGAGVGLGIDATLDFSKLADRARAILNDAVARSNAVLGKITPYLTPGSWLRARFNAEVEQLAGKLITDQGLRGAVIADVQLADGGGAGDPALIGWLSGKITDAIDGAADALVGKIDGARDGLIDAIAAELPAAIQTAFRNAAAEEAAKLSVKALIDKVLDPFKAELLSHLPGKALGRALHEVKAAADDGVDTLDKAVAPLRKLVADYQQLLAKAQKTAGDAANARISASIKLEELWHWGVEEKIVGTFTGKEGRDAFARITTGDFAALRQLLLPALHGDSQPAGFTLARDRSHLRRSAKRSSKANFELVVFGFGESGAVEVTGDASVLVDGDGKVQVDAGGTLQARFQTSTEQREVSFVDTFSLRLARAMAASEDQRSVEVGVSISHVDKDLELHELTGFIGSLAEAGLVSNDTVPAATAHYQRWAAGGGRLRADINAKLQLTPDQVRTMLLIDRRSGNALVPEARKFIVQKAVEQLRPIWGEARERRLDDAIESLSDPAIWDRPLPRLPLPDFLYARLVDKARLTDFYKPHEKVPGPISEYFTEQRRVDGIVDLIDLVGQIYLATPEAGAGGADLWSERDYAEKEHDAADDSRMWLQTGGAFFHISDAVAPVTVAFLNLVCALSGIPGNAGSDGEGLDAMALTLTHRDSADKVLEEVPLTRTGRGALPG